MKIRFSYAACVKGFDRLLSQLTRGLVIPMMIRARITRAHLPSNQFYSEHLSDVPHSGRVKRILLSVTRKRFVDSTFAAYIYAGINAAQGVSNERMNNRVLSAARACKIRRPRLFFSDKFKEYVKSHFHV
jgi:hypothetical protein